MKNLLTLLSLTFVSVMMMVYTASLSSNTTVAVSSKTDLPHDPHQFKYEAVDCNAFPPDSTIPRMKAFVPDTTLTSSMHIFKPSFVDPGIFAPVDSF